MSLYYCPHCSSTCPWYYKAAKIVFVNMLFFKLDYDVKDGERLPLAIKDMGPCEMFPQTLSHNPNGRYG